MVTPASGTPAPPSPLPLPRRRQRRRDAYPVFPFCQSRSRVSPDAAGTRPSTFLPPLMTYLSGSYAFCLYTDTRFSLTILVLVLDFVLVYVFFFYY